MWGRYRDQIELVSFGDGAIILNMPIQILADDVAAKIAAGEVVERPANVAKELLENSLDAGATEIRIEIREGGQRLLRVIDNGAGILPDEAALAFERHATSKLQTAEDLNQIGTFGFRGEALYSIAAVSHLTLTTRAAAHTDSRDSSATVSPHYGVQLRLEGGELVHQQRTGTPVGTVVNVEHLFFNMPARKKFLRKAATEAGRIRAVVQHYALAYPERRFSFVNDGRLIFQSTGSGDLFDVLVKIYGLENAKQMVPIGGGRRRDATQREAASGLADEVNFMEASAIPPSLRPDPLASIVVYGYASLPVLTRANRTNIDLFVNRRYVEDRQLTFAVVQAYHTLLPGGRYPLAALFLEMDPSLVDVNVHPQKTQVRFQEDRVVFNTLQRAVRRVVVQHATIPDMDLPKTMPGRFAPDTASSGAISSGWSQRRDSIVNAGQRSFDMYIPPTAAPPPLVPPQQIGKEQPEETSHQPEAESPPPDPPTRESVVEQSAAAKLPPLRVVGQVGAMYIITEGPEGLFLIDQHAAHERILYEKFMAQKYGAVDRTIEEETGQATAIPQQQLLTPLTLHAGGETAGLVAQHLARLQQIGFDIEPFGGETFLVRAVPSVLSGQDPLRTLEEIVTSLGRQRNLVGEELEARLVKMVCKRAAIKAGQLLSDIEMQELVRQLEECQSPRTCPHGRPTMIQLSAGELEKAFGRV